jgi:hypothetical protein
MQFADHGKLLLRVVLGLAESSVSGMIGSSSTRQTFLPLLAARHVIGRVLVRLGLFEHVTKAPGYFVGAAFDVAVAFACRRPARSAMAFATDGFSAMKRRMVIPFPTR